MVGVLGDITAIDSHQKPTLSYSHADKHHTTQTMNIEVDGCGFHCSSENNVAMCGGAHDPGSCQDDQPTDSHHFPSIISYICLRQDLLGSPAQGVLTVFDDFIRVSHWGRRKVDARRHQADNAGH